MLSELARARAERPLLAEGLPPPGTAALDLSEKCAAIPRTVDGGEVVSWARGHELAAGDALLEFVNYVADGDCGIGPELSAKARKALDLMERRSAQGWDADEEPEDWQAAVNRAAHQAREVFCDSHDDATQAIEYMKALLQQAAPVVQGGDA